MKTDKYLEAKHDSSLPDEEYLPDRMASILSVPISNLDKDRNTKVGYNEVPIDTNNSLFNEPVINIADFGIAGQSYYSRPNAVTGKAIAGIPKALYLRKSVAETLASINQALQEPAIVGFFGDEVELYVEDALRPISLQTQLHDDLIPKLLKKIHPKISDTELSDRLKDIIAIPSINPLKPSPHTTGGAFDIILRYSQADKGFVANCNVPMGYFDGETSARINPDYFEQNMPQSDEDRLAQRNRRAFYAIMAGSAFGFDSGLVNNPTELWHWSRGDQMWAKLKNEPTALYSVAKEQKYENT